MPELTDRTLRAIAVGTRTEFTDESYRTHPRRLRRGLVLLVSPSGSKAWMLKQQRDGKRVKLTLGHYPELGLAAARELFDDITDSPLPPDQALALLTGTDVPAVEPAAAAVLTVRRLVRAFIETDAEPHNRQWREQQRVLETSLVAQYGDLPADAVTPDMIAALLNDYLAAGTPGAAQQALKNIRACYAWATGTKRARRRVVARSEVRQVTRQVALLNMPNPTTGLAVPRYRPRSFHFADPLVFLPRLAASKIRPDAKAVLRVQYETFARVGEVCGMRWDELDLKKREWLLPAERSKTGEPHRVMLSEQTAALLKALPRGSEYVFPRPLDPEKPLDNQDVVKCINRHRGTLKVHKDFSSHSLRHTGRTWLASQGCPSEIAERLLNHSVDRAGDMAARYNQHDYAAQKRAWTQQWVDYLAG